MKQSSYRIGRFLTVSLLFTLAGCDKPGENTESAPDTATEAAEAAVSSSPNGGSTADSAELKATKKKVVQTYADIVYANYSDTLKVAKTLQQAAGALVNDPSEQALRSAQEAWLASRVPYLQTEVYRFYGGPIDHQEDGVEGLLNAWPMDENYIDYARGNAEAGIIQNESEFPEISPTLLVELNERGGEANISTGYHAIEFLLWGQDFSDSGPGDRSHTDYVIADSGPGLHAERRGQYLLTLCDLLVEDLRTLVEAWSPEIQGNYREQFLKAPADESIQHILQGMGMLAGFELSGERLTVAYETQSQEDEHSCFSDNTHVDMIEDTRGLVNVWLGRYEALDGSAVGGPGVRDLALLVDADLADRVSADLERALQAAVEIPTPFDQAIKGDDTTPGRATIRKLIDSLLEVASGIGTLAEKLGVPISIEGEEGESQEA